jgi:UDP-2,3-diacylglucosamine pyrophosphatase LpxH
LGVASGFNYLLFSDVHLGSDIVPHLRPWATTSWLAREADIDERIVSLLTHYRRERDPERPWCLVLAGDFLDLVGVSIPLGELRTTPTEEEQRHGLGSAPDHVVRKVEAICARHPRVFRALMEFVADGHTLIIVRGNHDIELHWQSAQRALVNAIVEHAPAEQEAELRARISIHPWFFAVKDLLYVEHGHEFDAMCCYGDPLLPTCPRDSRRIRWTPFSVLLRIICRPTRGLSTSAYSYVSFAAYVRLLFKLGLRGTAGIAVRFAEASLRLMKEAWVFGQGHRPVRTLVARARHRRFAARQGVSSETLEALRGLYVPPAAKSLRFVIRSLYIDRIAASLLTLLLVAGFVTAALFASKLWMTLAAVPAALVLAYAIVGLERGLEPAQRMREKSARIAELFGARWVVMGHTHEAQLAPLGEGRSYVNLGYWGEDDVPEERSADAPHSPCTYLLLRHVDGDYRAELLSWNAEHRPAQAPGPVAEGSKSGDREPPVPRAA